VHCTVAVNAGIGFFIDELKPQRREEMALATVSRAKGRIAV